MGEAVSTTPRERYRQQVRSEIKERAWEQIAHCWNVWALAQRDRQADGPERSRALSLFHEPRRFAYRIGS